MIVLFIKAIFLGLFAGLIMMIGFKIINKAKKKDDKGFIYLGLMLILAAISLDILFIAYAITEAIELT